MLGHRLTALAFLPNPENHNEVYHINRNKLRPKSYEFIVNPNQQRFGVIAQELEQVLPTLVNTSNGTKSVNYLEIIPFLIGSIQNLKQTVESLQYDVIMLQSQLKYSR